MVVGNTRPYLVLYDAKIQPMCVVVMLEYVMPLTLILNLYLDSAGDEGDCVERESAFKVTHAQLQTENLRERMWEFLLCQNKTKRNISFFRINRFLQKLVFLYLNFSK